jgi:hypothetical protein
MMFEPAKNRQSLEELMIPHARNAKFAEAFQLQALAGFGSSILETAMECLLLGHFEVGKELLSKAQGFLRAAIEHKQIPPNYGRGGTESLRLRDFAMCNYFLEKRSDCKNLKEAVKWKEIWFEETGESQKTEVQLTLPHYLDAEEYDVLFQRFEEAGLKAPKNLRNIKGEGTMSYVLARHRLGLEYSADEVQAALNSFLKRNVRAAWLDRGLYTDVALWMKIAFWKPGDDPIETLLRCYDYLPDFERPQYPAPPVAAIQNSSGPKRDAPNPTAAVSRVDQDFYLGAYGPARKESLEDCADRLADLFEALAAIDKSLASWYGARGSKKAHARIDAQNEKRLIELLSAAQNGQQNKGFQVSFSNAKHSKHAIRVSITCDSRTERVGNSLKIDFPRELGSLASADKMSDVLAAVARAWEPQWAGVQSRQATQLRPFHPDKPFVDWMLYLCRDRLPNGATLHWPARVIPLRGNLGATIITQDEPPDPRNPEHAANVDRARRALGL